MDSNLEKLVKEYIKDKGYTWTPETISREFDKYQMGYYVSFTAKDVIDNCMIPYINSLVNH